MEMEHLGEYAASAAETSAGQLVLVSKVKKDEIELLYVAHVEIKGRISSFLKHVISQVEGNVPLDGISLRANLSSAWGAFMTEHIMRVHDYLDRDASDVVLYTAWRFSTLTAWGEASAARELALSLKIPVTTIHNRLRLARERGILASPGAGARLGR